MSNRLERLVSLVQRHSCLSRCEATGRTNNTCSRSRQTSGLNSGEFSYGYDISCRSPDHCEPSVAAAAGGTSRTPHPSALLDVQAAGGAVAVFNLSFVVAPDHLLKTADEMLRSRIRCTNALRRDIRAVAKAYLDEADELKRAARAIKTDAARIQIENLSPPGMIEKAKSLRTVQFPNKELREKVRAVANSYVLIAEKNQQLFDEFKEKYRDKLPPTK